MRRTHRASRRVGAFLVFSAVAGSAACASPSAPEFAIEPIDITSVEVAVMESVPAQASAHVKGVIGDGCAELLPLSQSRSGSEVNVTIERRRPVGAVCIQIAKLYDEVIRLEGTFPPGDYLLRVNGTETHFRVD